MEHIKPQDFEVDFLRKIKAFNEYLNSDKRRESFATNPDFGTDLLEERLSEVTNADVENYFLGR